MSEMLGPSDPAAGLLGLSSWTAGAGAALLVFVCLLAFSRARDESTSAVLAHVALMLIAAGAAFITVVGSSQPDIAAERRALDARAQELLVRAATPGSVFACLDAMAGDAVESSCEKALFQTPETTAAALSYVTAQLALLADVAAHARRPGIRAPVALDNLRRAIETDRFGLVARVLAVRDGCTPTACAAFGLVGDSSRIAVNLAERTYDLYVARHAATWPASMKGPVAGATAAPEEGAAPAAAAGRGDLFFPSAASIPPVTIMNAEPPAPPETSNSSVPSPTRQTPLPARRPAQSGGTASSGTSGQGQPARPPIDLKAATRPGSTANVPQ